MPIKIPKIIALPVVLLILLLISYILTNIGSGKSSFENFFLGSQNLFGEMTNIEDPVEKLIEEAPQNFNGNMAIFVKDLKTAKTYQVNADQKFTSASLYKLAVMYKTYDSLAKNEISLDGILSGNSANLDKMLSGAQNGQGQTLQIQSPNPSQTSQTIAYQVSEALRLMITISDNYSALILAERLGWQNIDQLMEDEGFLDIDLIDADQPTITARAVGALLEKIYRNQAVSSQSSEEMKKLLLDQKINDRIPKYLPEDIKVGHKTGELDNLRHDAGIVLGQKSDYIFVFLTDTTLPVDAAEHIAQLSKKFFEALERS